MGDPAEGRRAMWSAGDYPQIARRLEPVATVLAEAVGAGPGQRLLDVATGTGNAAIAAARRGATVTACDLTPRMLDLARQRMLAELLDVELAEADAADLPFDDGSFDAVVSAFGVVFAAPPAVAVSELARVLRPTGRLALAAWRDQRWRAPSHHGAVSRQTAPPG